jgi:hypothetical protein
MGQASGEARSMLEWLVEELCCATIAAQQL